MSSSFSNLGNDDNSSPLFEVLQFSPASSTYVISAVDPENPATLSVSESTLEASYEVLPSNILYPLFDSLLTRSDVLSKASNPLMKKALSSIRASKVDMAVAAPQENIVKDSVAALTSSISPTHANDVMDLLKKDDIQTLLAKSRDRLNQLVEADLPEAQQKFTEATGITISSTSSGIAPISSMLTTQNRKNALAALDNLMSTSAGIDTSLASLNDQLTTTLEDEALKESLSSRFSDVMATLGDASVTDSTLQSLVSTFNERTSEFQKMTGTLLETKTVVSLFEGE